MEHTAALEYVFDGICYRGEIPTAPPKKPGGNRVIKSADWQAFEAAVVKHILDEGRQGPETFRFLRKFCAFSTSQIASQLDVERSTLEAWESGDVPIPHSVSATVGMMAAERARPKIATGMAAILSRLRSSGARPQVVQIKLAKES